MHDIIIFYGLMVLGWGTGYLHPKLWVWFLPVIGEMIKALVAGFVVVLPKRFRR
jgi:hypothetical protein